MNLLFSLIILTGMWTSNSQYYIRQSVNRIADRMEEVSGIPAWLAFKSGYGQLEITSGVDPYLAYNCEARPNGFACKAGIEPHPSTIIHELGHVFDYHTGAGDILAKSTIVTENGEWVTGIKNGEWQRGTCGYVDWSLQYMAHPPLDANGLLPEEEWADMFLNWANKSFADNECGRARMAWMDDTIADLLKSFLLDQKMLPNLNKLER